MARTDLENVPWKDLFNRFTFHWLLTVSGRAGFVFLKERVRYADAYEVTVEYRQASWIERALEKPRVRQAPFVCGTRKTVTHSRSDDGSGRLG